MIVSVPLSMGTKDDDDAKGDWTTTRPTQGMWRGRGVDGSVESAVVHDEGKR